MSLRGRLVLLMVALVALGVVVSDLVAAAALRSVLRDQIEDSLDGAVPYAQRMLTGETAIDPMPPPQAGSPETPSMELRAGRLDATGALVGDPVGLFSRDGTPFLAIPPARLAATSGGGTLRFDARLAGERYRVLLAPLAGTGDVMALIISLRDVDDTLGRLQWVHLLVAEGLLAGVAGLGWLLVRLGLRPLRHMADTADAVAAGAVDSRVEVSGGAEVARLGAALNAAFDARWESEERLRTFVADASHELRTPLSAIRGYAELVRSGALGGDEANRALERVESEATRMGNLVGDLLTLTSCDQQRPLTLVPLELTALAAEALADAAAVEPGRPSRLVAPHPVAVIADEAYVRQVLSNLLANVRHHTPPEVPVEVRVSAGRDTARVEVVDWGPGLPAGVRARAFERFWRADQSRGADRRAGGGAGLGLAIVAAIAEAHGGKARILPSADAGAHVVVTLPLCPLGADDPEAPEAPEAPDVLTPAGRSSQEVLN